MNIPRFSKCSRYFLAGGTISSTDSTFVKLLVGTYDTITAGLDTLALDAYGGGVGTTWSTIGDLHRAKRKENRLKSISGIYNLSF